MRISDWSSDVCSSDLCFSTISPIGDSYLAISSAVPTSLTIWRNLTCSMMSLAMCPCSRSEEHTSELQSLMRISYAVFCLKKKKQQITLQGVLLTSTSTFDSEVTKLYKRIISQNRH